MTRRLKFVIAQPITIVGFFLATALLLADIIAITASPTYQLPADHPAAPALHHALSPAFYYAIMAVVIYLLIALLNCWTVFGVYRGHFGRQFNLTAAQRTLMLQTMSFVTYLLLGALVFSHVEGWRFLDTVYWADVTLLTVGLGDISPATHTGRSLLIPFAVGGIVTIGLVIGSIRTLVLERGQKKISARMMEKKRIRAIESVDSQKRRIRVSRFQTIPFNESFTNAAQKREQEFRVMRSVQDCAERDRKWMALGVSTTMAFTLWLVGAVVFYLAERDHQEWTYFQALYFSYTSLLTIGYGDFTPISYSGRSFFVLWSLLAVPTLTILISDMGDTVVQVFSNVTVWIGSLTVLPDENGFRATAKEVAKQLSVSKLNPKDFETQKPPGFVPAEANKQTSGNPSTEYDHQTIQNRIADRLAEHLEAEELREAAEAQSEGDSLDRDIHFYHFILARECQKLLKDLKESPPKRYQWGEWEYFVKLMANDYDAEIMSGQYLVPKELRLPETRAQWDKKRENHRWSWLSEKSPLMGYQTETEWLLERLSACLEKEMKDSRMLPKKRKERRQPPISIADMIRAGRIGGHGKGDSDGEDGSSRPGSNNADSGTALEKLEKEKDMTGGDKELDKQEP